jgi:exonuclease III
MQARVVEATQFRVATFNINVVTSRTRRGMLVEFLSEQENVMFVQEITASVLDNIWGYTAYINLGTTRQGTCIHCKGSSGASGDNMSSVGQGQCG